LVITKDGPSFCCADGPISVASQNDQSNVITGTQHASFMAPLSPALLN